MPTAVGVHLNLATALRQQGRVDEALVHEQEARRLVAEVQGDRDGGQGVR